MKIGFNKLIYIILLPFLATLLVSCEGQLSQINPNSSTEDTFWKTESDFEQALITCYVPLKCNLQGSYYGTRSVMLRIARADEVVFRNDLSEVYQSCYFTNTNGNTLIQGMFQELYSILYRTNKTMEMLEERGTNFSQDFKDMINGECLFLRAYSLFLLGKEFKNAPLKLQASQVPSTFPIEKSTQEELWQQALKDVSTAIELLPVKPRAKVAASKGAGIALKGKIYLYMKEFDNVVSTLTPLTKAPYTYKLVEDFHHNFDVEHEFNEESIFELPMGTGGGTSIWGSGEHSNAVQTTSRPKEYAAPEVGGWYEAVPTKQILDEFTKELDKDGNYDTRARNSIAWDYPGSMYYQKPFRTVFNEDKWNTSWILKYQNWKTCEKEGKPTSSINDRAIRYAEVLLMLAEGELFKSTPDLEKAVSYLNIIRDRANLNLYSGTMNKEEIFKDLEHQRVMEFFVEGERFYDLRRWGLLEERLKTCDMDRYNQFITGKVGNTNKYYYYPIPSKEIESNPLCTPNEGW